MGEVGCGLDSNNVPNLMPSNNCTWYYTSALSYCCSWYTIVMGCSTFFDNLRWNVTIEQKVAYKIISCCFFFCSSYELVPGKHKNPVKFHLRAMQNGIRGVLLYVKTKYIEITQNI